MSEQSAGRALGGTLLDVVDLQVRYGAITAIKGISFTVRGGEIVALIGASGAGTATPQKTVSGRLPPAAGSIPFDVQRIDGTPPPHLIELGICHVPEGR